MDLRHPLHNHKIPRKWLKSHFSFLNTTGPLSRNPLELWLEEWHQSGIRGVRWLQRGISPKEQIATGNEQPRGTRQNPNRLRVGERWYMATRKLWGCANADQCSCESGATQTMSHLRECSLAPSCAPYGLSQPINAAFNCAKYWTKEISSSRLAYNNATYAG